MRHYIRLSPKLVILTPKLPSLLPAYPVLGVRTESKWKGVLINSIHNGGNALERKRILAKHPAEPECVLEDRVLGWLAPTRGAYP